MIWAILWVTTAIADAPSVDVAAIDVVDSQTDAQGIEVVEVYGDHALRQARADLIRQMGSLGYTPIEGRGELRFRPPESWMGVVRFSRDGALTFSRPLVSFDKGSLHGADYDGGVSVGVDDALNDSEALTVASSAEARVFSRDNPQTPIVPKARFWIRPERAVMDAVEARVREGVQQQLAQYRAVLWRTNLATFLSALSDRLDRLWREGEPLEDGAQLGSLDERREALLAYWATRPEGPEGEAICDAVGRYLRQVVQDSDAPVTHAQWQAAQSRRSDGIRLDLGGVDGAPIRWLDQSE